AVRTPRAAAAAKLFTVRHWLAGRTVYPVFCATHLHPDGNRSVAESGGAMPATWRARSAGKRALVGPFASQGAATVVPDAGGSARILVRRGANDGRCRAPAAIRR